MLEKVLLLLVIRGQANLRLLTWSLGLSTRLPDEFWWMDWIWMKLTCGLTVSLFRLYLRNPSFLKAVSAKILAMEYLMLLIRPLNLLCAMLMPGNLCKAYLRGLRLILASMEQNYLEGKDKGWQSPVP